MRQSALNLAGAFILTEVFYNLVDTFISLYIMLSLAESRNLLWTSTIVENRLHIFFLKGKGPWTFHRGTPNVTGNIFDI